MKSVGESLGLSSVTRRRVEEDTGSGGMVQHDHEDHHMDYQAHNHQRVHRREHSRPISREGEVQQLHRRNRTPYDSSSYDDRGEEPDQRQDGRVDHSDGVQESW